MVDSRDSFELVKCVCLGDWKVGDGLVCQRGRLGMVEHHSRLGMVGWDVEYGRVNVHGWHYQLGGVAGWRVIWATPLSAAAASSQH